MESKRVGFSWIVLGIIFLISGCVNGKSQIVLKAADIHELNYPTTQGLVKMAELLKEWTKGRIKVEIYHTSQLGTEDDTLEQTVIGSIDINRISISPLTKTVPEMKVFALPYIFRDREHMFKVCNGEIGKNMLNNLTNHGLVGLTYYDSGDRNFYTKTKPIRTIADLKGLKIRIQKAELMEDMVKSLGVIPVQLGFDEIYNAINSGVIDGAENNLPSYTIKDHYKIAKFYSRDGHTRVPEVVIFSKKTWDTLKPEDKDLIIKAAEESQAHQIKLWEAYETESLNLAINNGSEIITNVNKTLFMKAMKSVYAKHGKGFEALIEKVKAE